MSVLCLMSHRQVAQSNAQVAQLTSQAQQANNEATALAAYSQFVSMSQQRVGAVEQLAQDRFDWAHAFHELGRVLPVRRLAQLGQRHDRRRFGARGGGPARLVDVDVRRGCLDRQPRHIRDSRGQRSDDRSAGVYDQSVGGRLHTAAARADGRRDQRESWLVDGHRDRRLGQLGQRWRLPGRVLGHRHLHRAAHHYRDGGDGCRPDAGTGHCGVDLDGARGQRFQRRHAAGEWHDRTKWHDRIERHHRTGRRLERAGRSIVERNVRGPVMRERDRFLLIGGVVLAVLVVSWMFWVSPERKAAAAAQAQVTSEKQTLSTAESQLQTAQASKNSYAAAYTALVGVGKAVPATPEVPSLIYELDQASNLRDVTFDSITSGGGSSGSSSSAASSSASAPAAFTTLPFTFEFTGTFFDLYHLLGRLNSFAVQTKNGTLIVTGRLLTIQGVSLVGAASSSSSGASGSSAVQMLHGTVTASAYVLPPTAPSSGTSSGGTATTPATGGTTAGATPAVIQPGS